MQNQPQKLDISRYRAQGYNPRPAVNIQKRRIQSIDGIQAPGQQNSATPQQPQLMKTVTNTQQPQRPVQPQHVQQKAPVQSAPRPMALQSQQNKAPIQQAPPPATHQQRQSVPQTQVHYAQAPAQNPTNHIQQNVQSTAPKAKKQGPVKRLFSFRFNNKRSMVFASLALCLFLAGVGVNLKSFMVSRKIQQTVEAAADTSDQKAGANSGLDESPVTKQQIAAYQVAPNMPRYLKIAELGVFSRVKQMGLTNSGAVDAPKSVFDTGWYNGSAKPGEDGAVFVDGHVSGLTKGGVFVGLKKLKPGSKIQVEMGDGRAFTYKVVATEKYDANNVDMAKALRSIEPGKNGLNLMTCAGKYNEDKETFDHRLVVFTVQE